MLAPAKRMLPPRTRNGLIAAVLAAGLIAPSRQQPVAGKCYEMTRGPWRPAMDVGEDSVFSAVPRRVRFTTARSSRWWRDSAAFAVEPLSGRTVHGPGAWRWRREGRELSVLWSTGYSGVTAELSIDGDTLRGTARTFWDFGRDPQEALLTAAPISCL